MMLDPYQCLNFCLLPRMAALRFFLHQDDLKAGDTGSAAQLEAQKEEEEHIKLIQVEFKLFNKGFNSQAFQMNEEENARVAKRRTDRLLKEAEERRYNIRLRLRCPILQFRLKINADLEAAKIEEEQRLQVTKMDYLRYLLVLDLD